MIIAGLGAAAVLIALLARPRRSGEPPAGPVLPVPAVELVALGVSGSGKTVFLASLFHALHVPLGERPYFLATDAAARIALSGVLREVSDPARPWPAGTMVGETRSFGFDCLARNGVGWAPVLRINYLDYAGELLEQARGEDSAALGDLEARINRADAVLGMLDGRRILQYLRGDPAGRTYLTAVVQPLLGIMATARNPVYLLVTKWDLVRGFGEPADASDNTRLDHVRQALLSLPQVSGLVQMRSIVRLIPVSSVGPDFATYDTASGRVAKRSDGTLRPVNVDVPIAAVLPDLFRRFEDAIDTRARAALDAQVRSMMRLDPAQAAGAVAQFLARPAGVAVRTALDAVIGRPYSSEVVGLMLDWMSGPYRHKGEQLAAFRAEGDRRLGTAHAARVEVLEHFRKTMYLFEAHLPASRLWVG